MNILVKKLARVLCLSAAFFSITPHVLAQTVTLYPYSSISFYSNKAGVTLSACPSGGDFNAFSRVIIANGWYIIQMEKTTESHEGVGSGYEKHNYAYSIQTAHPDSKRVRHWLVRSQNLRQQEHGVSAESCSTRAILQGEQLDDSLSIDIGVLVGNKPQKGEQIAPIQVIAPVYCLALWPTAKKDSMDTGQKNFDCSTIGISVLAPIQTENLPK